MKTRIESGKTAVLYLHFIFACLFIRTNLEAQIAQVQKQLQTRQNVLPAVEKLSIRSLSQKNIETIMKIFSCDTCADGQKLTPTHISDFHNDESFTGKSSCLRIEDLVIRKLQRGERLQPGY